MAACVICGDVTPLPKKRGQAPKYCSDLCRLVGRGLVRQMLRETQPDIVRERNRIKHAKWRATHPENFRAYRKKHYANNRGRISEERRRRHAANPESERNAAKRRYAQQREERRKKAAKYRRRADVREKARRATEQWRTNNPERAKENGYRSFANWRALLLGAFVETVSRKVVFERDKGVCGICLTPVEPSSNWEIDHVIPISKGGPHSYANVQLSHRRCNRAKCNRAPPDG